jgi:hypothetical protein
VRLSLIFDLERRKKRSVCPIYFSRVAEWIGSDEGEGPIRITVDPINGAAFEAADREMSDSAKESAQN